MTGHVRILRTFVAIMIVLVMVTSASASAVGPMLTNKAAAPMPGWEARLGVKGHADMTT